jgi:hypothetical protein
MVTDTSLDASINRQWYWMLCNEPFAFWQVYVSLLSCLSCLFRSSHLIPSGPPAGYRSLMPHAVPVDYYQRQCDILFPRQGNTTHGSASGHTTEKLNAITQGWDYTTTARLLWTNG